MSKGKRGHILTFDIDVDGSTMATFTHDLRGLLATRTLENGASSTYIYDAAARLQAMRGTVPVTYSLNAVGQRTGRHDAAFGPETYAYDAIDQVIGANYGGVRSEGFAYDAMGNRQSASDTAAGITAYTVRADNTYAMVGGVLAAHDGNGNMTDLGEGTKGEYDAQHVAVGPARVDLPKANPSGRDEQERASQNRLVRAERNGTVTEFEYDGFNRCLQRRTTRAGGGAESLRLVYAGWDLIEERDGEGALTAQYVHGVQTDDIVAKSATSGTVYYHRDGLGSTVALSDATGQIVERYRYDVFGRVEIRSATGERVPVSLFGNRFLFTGREWLSEVGLYDYRNRVYSAELGRFLQTDPIRFSAGDGNLYRYVSNNPVSWVDPFGLEKQCTDWMFDKDLSSTISQERREERPGAWTRVGLPMQTNLVRGVFTRLVQRWQRIIAIFGIQNITTVSQYRRYCVDECGNGEWEYSTDTDVKTNERFIKNRIEHKDTYSTSGPFMGPGGVPPMPSP